MNQIYIISKKPVKIDSSTLPYFFADTPEEAEEIYDKHKKIMNSIAYNYSIATNIPKADLFGEALYGLAKACKNWNKERSDDFKTYAIYIIKDTLQEYIRKNSTIVSIPAYIKKSNAHLKEVRTICDRYDVDEAIILIEQEIPSYLSTKDAIRLTNLVLFLIKAAERAKVDYEEFLKKIEVLPKNATFEDCDDYEIEYKCERMLEATLLVGKLRNEMDDIMLAICDGIMADKSFEEIGKEISYSKAFISNKIKEFRETINYEEMENYV